MRQKLMALSVMMILPTFLLAAPPSIPGLFGTGVDGQGNPLPVNATELHYTLTFMPEPAGSPLAIPVGVIPQAGTPRLDKTWWPFDNSGSWIGPELNANQDAAPGDYIYTMTFDLTSYDPNSIVICGQWSSDNASSISLNGAKTQFETPYVPYPDGPFAYIYDFSLNRGFVPGVNTLEFHVHNESGPTGLLVRNLRSNQDEHSIDATVELLPKVLNSRTQGRWVFARISLPKEYNVLEIDCPTIRITKVNQTIIDPPIFLDTNFKPIVPVKDFNRDGRQDLLVKFDRQQVIQHLREGINLITIQGNLLNYRLSGDCTIKFIRSHKGK